MIQVEQPLHYCKPKAFALDGVVFVYPLKNFKDTVLIISWNSFPVVFDAIYNVLTIVLRPDMDKAFAIGVKIFESVVKKYRENHFKLILIAETIRDVIKLYLGTGFSYLYCNLIENLLNNRFGILFVYIRC